MSFHETVQQQLVAYSFYGNNGWDYAVAIWIFVVLFIILRLFKTIVLARMHALAKKTKTQVDDYVIGIVNSIHWPYLAFVSFYIGAKTLTLPGAIATTLDVLLFVFTAFYLVRAFQSVIEVTAEHYISKGHQEDRPAVHIVTVVLKWSLWVFAALLLFANLGFNITSLIAGLGIGGLAIALAAQNILSDIFASISIYFDKPFKIGDFIIVGDKMGTVQHIGIKTTRVKALQGEEIVFSNRELTNAEVRNFKKMEKRRIVFAFGVTYDTPVEKMNKIPDTVKKLIDKQKLAEADRVHFKDFGDSSLNFEAVYYMTSPEYNEYMNTQQAINLDIMKAFQKDGIEFAFPTRTIYLQK